MYGVLMAGYYYIEYYYLDTTFYVSKDHNLKKVSKNYKTILFQSKIEEGSDVYNLEIKTAADPKRKQITLNQNIKIGSVFDDKGYLHRYLVKSTLEKCLLQFEAAAEKKK